MRPTTIKTYDQFRAKAMNAKLNPQTALFLNSAFGAPASWLLTQGAAVNASNVKALSKAAPPPLKKATRRFNATAFLQRASAMDSQLQRFQRAPLLVRAWEPVGQEQQPAGSNSLNAFTTAHAALASSAAHFLLPSERMDEGLGKR